MIYLSGLSAFNVMQCPDCELKNRAAQAPIVKKSTYFWGFNRHHKRNATKNRRDPRSRKGRRSR